MATTKPDMTRVWAANASAGDIEDPDVTVPGKFSAGWQAEIPPFENFNFLQQLFTQGLAYINEQGIGLYDAITDYPVDGVVRGSDNSTYKSVIVNGPASSVVDPVGDLTGTWVIWLTNYNDIKSGRKNAVINGDFGVAIRGTSQTSDGYGSVDRWTSFSLGSTKVFSQEPFTIGQSDVPDNPTFYSRAVVTSSAGAGNFANIGHRVESVETFSGETCTLTFWAKADASKDIAVDFTQHFGTGGSPSADVSGINPSTLSLTTAWQRFKVTTNIPTVLGKTIGTNDNDYLKFNMWFDAGSNFDARTNSLGQQSGTFEVSHVQLETGFNATNFERRTLSQEILLCRAYAVEILAIPGLGPGYSSQANQIQTSIFTPVRMRGVPSLSGPTSYTAFLNGASPVVTVGSIADGGANVIFVRFDGTFSNINYPCVVRANGGNLLLESEL